MGGVVICAQGMRAAESPGRARRPILAIEPRATAKRLKHLEPAEAIANRRPNERVVLNWQPIHHLTDAEVWEACGTSVTELEYRRAAYRRFLTSKSVADLETAVLGWPCHVAYVYGATRLSCALCIIASASDLEVGARHNPGAFGFLLDLEIRSGRSFQKAISLQDIARRIDFAAAS